MPSAASKDADSRASAGPGIQPRNATSGCPHVAVAVTHPTMRALIIELLERACCIGIAVPDPARLWAVVANATVALAIVDGANFPACCRDHHGDFALERVIVIGAEPDRAYETAALRHGAGAWISRDDVGDKLPIALAHILRRSAAKRHGRPVYWAGPREEGTSDDA